MARKRRVGRYSEEFRRAALARVESGEMQKDVARELDIQECLLWRWRHPWARRVKGKAEQQNVTEVEQLKQLLAEKELALSFFEGALQKVEARRRQSSSSGEQVSTTKFVQ